MELVSSRRVQTNEIRRCTDLLPAVMLAGLLADRPLALIEAGASAGLHLTMDTYAYHYGTANSIGEAAPRLLLRCVPASRQRTGRFHAAVHRLGVGGRCGGGRAPGAVPMEAQLLFGDMTLAAEGLRSLRSFAEVVMPAVHDATGVRVRG